jgi:hypothetical protein
MNSPCRKGVLSLFTDKNRQTNVKIVCFNGLLLWTPMRIALTVFRSEFSITNGLPGSRRIEDRQTKVREDRQIYKATPIHSRKSGAIGENNFLSSISILHAPVEGHRIPGDHYSMRRPIANGRLH